MCLTIICPRIMTGDFAMHSAAALILWFAASGAVAPDPAIADELSRLEGHRVSVAADGKSYEIEDVAGEGRPVVGVVERRGPDLWLVAEDGRSFRLVGPLAKPRMAGPGYKVWVLGNVTARGDMRARRLGVLARPKK
jgi:hypothetical protein